MEQFFYTIIYWVKEIIVKTKYNIFLILKKITNKKRKLEINGEFIKICKIFTGGGNLVSTQCKIVKRNLIVNVSEELDHHNAEIIRNKIDKLIIKHNIKCVIFDFSNTKFMDSSGIGVIMGRYKNIKNMGGNVVVTNVNTRMDRIFKLSGLYRIINSYDSVDQALKNISNIS